MFIFNTPFIYFRLFILAASNVTLLEARNDSLFEEYLQLRLCGLDEKLKLINAVDDAINIEKRRLDIERRDLQIQRSRLAFQQSHV